MRTRKKELDHIADLLSQPAESVDELAKEIWQFIDDSRRQRDMWVVGVQYDGVGQFLFGPYESKANAEKDIEGRGKLKALRQGDSGRVFKLLEPSIVFGDTPNVQEELTFR